MPQVDLRGLSLCAAEAKVSAMIAQCHELILLDNEFDNFVGRGISAAERLSKVALERARLAVVRDRLMDQFRAFVKTRALAVGWRGPTGPQAQPFSGRLDDEVELAAA